MQLSFYILLVKFIIIYNDYYVVNVKALVGQNVRRPNPNEYLFVVSLVRINSRKNSTSTQKICVGTLVTLRDVLTAEHCLEGERLPYTAIVLGSTNLNLSKKYSLLWWISYEWWHTKFREAVEFGSNDIAMLRLFENVPDNVIPAQISKVSNYNYYGLESMMLTWTENDNKDYDFIMHAGDVKIMTERQCSKKCSKIIKNNISLHWRFFCSIAEPPIILECGDSGGPLVHQSILIGINNGFCPPVGDEPLHKKINIHIGIQYYKRFIEDSIATPSVA